MKTKNVSRREFFRLTFIGGGNFVFWSIGADFFLKQTPATCLESEYRLNPEYRVIEVSNRELGLRIQTPEGHIFEYGFFDIEAYLIRAIARRQSVGPLIPWLARKYHLSNDQCYALVRNRLHKYKKSSFIYTI